MISLDGIQMCVSATSAIGVVGAGTRLHFIQRGPKAAARYSGGDIVRGWLVGRLSGSELTFRYVQREGSGELHHGHSVAAIDRLADGRLRITERFTWTSRRGSGINLFEELAPG